MRVVALISGGKDSCYNMMQCVSQGHEIVALANLRPANKDELDSYMYQTVGHHAIDLYSQAMGLPLYRRTIQGEAIEQGKNYIYNTKDEVEDLYELLKNVKSKIVFDAVAVGAVLSDYQRVRVENICSRLGLVCLSYLWRRNQKELLEEMISCHVEAIIIKVAALGLVPQKHLGKNLCEMYSHLCDINKKFDCHICGEGGEYETFTVDCPLFQKKIVIDCSEVVIHSDDAFAPVGYLNLTQMHLEDKIQKESQVNKALEHIPLYKGDLIMTSEEKLKSLIKQTDLEVHVVPEIFVMSDTVKHLKKKEIYTCRVMIKQCERYAWISGIKPSSLGRSIEEETEETMTLLQNTLTEIKSSLQHVLLVHIYLNNMKNYATVNSVYKNYFNLNPPARVCVETNFEDSVLFQLDCLVIIPDNTKGHDNMPRIQHDTMHVQSISHWAPANIGPYSQAVKVDKFTGFIAGCIGLWPSSMSIIDGGIYNEAPLALRHVKRILNAFIPGTSLSDVISGVCYVTKLEHVPIATAVWLNYGKMSYTTRWNDDDCVEEREEKDVENNVMTYVVVDKLPKEALVEWHIVSHCCSNRLNYRFSKDIFKDIQISLTSCSCLRHMCGSVKANTEILPPFSRKLNILEMMEYFIKTLELFITSCSFTANMLLILRIFFRIEIFKDIHDLFKKAVHDAVQTIFRETCPAIIFIPVSGLSSPNKIFSICGWLQTTYTEDEETH